MEKYSKQLVLDYIYGNDTNEYNIDELENNPTFMCDVMKISKDKNMYLYASDNVKKNYEFVKIVVEMFKNEQDFIIEVADYYLENANVNEDDITKLELNVIMNNILKDKEKRLPYAFYCMTKYESLMVDLKCLYNEEKDNDELLDFGLGYIYIYELYNESPYVTDYFATRLINTIFYSSSDSLEQFIHNNFKCKEIISEQGINNFILNYIAKQDSCLSGYVSTNINLIENLNKEINKILNNWDSYETNVYLRKMDIINRVGMDRYNELNLKYLFCDYLETVLEKLGLIDLYKKYFNDGVEGFILDENKLSCFDKIYLEFLEELVCELFYEKEKTVFLDKNGEKQQSKIVKFPKKA